MISNFRIEIRKLLKMESEEQLENDGDIEEESDTENDESEICQLADIQDSIQRMREGELVPPNSDKQSVEARLSSSCPSLTVESGEEGDTPTPRRRSRQQHYKDHKSHRKRSGRPRSPSVSTGESDEEVSEGIDFVDGHQHRSGSTSQPNTARDRTGSNALPAHFHPGP